MEPFGRARALDTHEVSPIQRWFRTVLRREPRDLLRGEPPTIELLRPVEDVPTDARVFAVLEFCLGVGEALLASGEAAAETAATMTRLAQAFGVDAVEIDITFTSITMCCRRGAATAPVTSMRIVQHRTNDLTRLAAVTRVVDRVVRGELSITAAEIALSDAVTARHPYPRWLATAGWGGLAAAVALLFGGGPAIWLAAFVVTALIDRIGRLLGRWGVAPFFLQVVGGFVASMGTLGLLAVGALPEGTGASLAIAASITVLLSGLSVVNAVQDAITNHLVTAAGGAVEVALLSAGLLTGVIVGLKIGLAVGLSVDPAEPVAADLTRFGISALAAALAASAYALAGYAPLRSLAAAALAGGVGWAAYGGLSQIAGTGPVVATGLAAVLIGLASELFGRSTATDRHVVVLAGIVPLLPGLTAYRGFYELASGRDVIDGLATVTLALAIGLALAAGVTFGQFVARANRRSRVG